jgi:excisionase family DNA binding protein
VPALLERRNVVEMSDAYLTPQEFADTLKIKRSRAYKWIQRGHIMAVAYGPKRRPTYLIPKTELRVGQERLR